MKKSILLIVLTFVLVSCYKMPDDPESLKDEYLSVADFKAYYTYHRTNDKVKVKGVIDKDSYYKFLGLLEQIKNDTSAEDVTEYNGQSVWFNIYDPVYGTSFIQVTMCHDAQINKNDLFSFFTRHSNDSLVYIFSKTSRVPLMFNLDAFTMTLSDTTEIILKNSE